MENWKMKVRISKIDLRREKIEKNFDRETLENLAKRLPIRRLEETRCLNLTLNHVDIAL